MEQSDDRAHQQPEAEVEVVDSSEDTSLLDLKQFANALRVPACYMFRIIAWVTSFSLASAGMNSYGACAWWKFFYVDLSTESASYSFALARNVLEMRTSTREVTA